MIADCGLNWLIARQSAIHNQSAIRNRRSAISSIPRKNVVGERKQRFALGAGRERIEGLLGALGVLAGATVRIVDRRVLLQAAQQLVPLFRRDGPRRDDVADDARPGAVVA